NVQSPFPSIEDQPNTRRSGRDVSLSPVRFFAEESLAMLPLTVPIWIAGLVWLFRGGYRALAWAWCITAAIILMMSPRVYYLFPAYPLLFAAGSIAFERWDVRWVKPVYC